MKQISTLFTAAVFLFMAGQVHAQTPKLTDPEIASVAVTANQVDINYAKVALEKSKNEDVLKFAKTMQADHQAVIDQAVALVTKLGVTPKDNDVSKKLMADSEATIKTMKTKSGKAFDKAYVDNEVAYHKAVIAAVEAKTQGRAIEIAQLRVLPRDLSVTSSSAELAIAGSRTCVFGACVFVGSIDTLFSPYLARDCSGGHRVLVFLGSIPLLLKKDSRVTAPLSAGA